MRQLWEGTDGAKWIRNISGKTKFTVLFSFALLSITIDNPRTLFVLFTLTLGLHLLAKTSIYKWQVLAILILLGIWGSMFSQALFFSQNPRTVIAVLIPQNFPILGELTGGIYIYREGIIYGAVQGLRASMMLTLGMLVSWNSDPRQLLKAFTSWSLSPQIAFMLVTAIRFFPVLAGEAGEVLIALRLRSNTESGRKSTFRHLPYIANPLLARSLRRAQTLALSVVSRGFFLIRKDNLYLWPFKEKLFCGCTIFSVITVLFCKLSYALVAQGYYYGVLRHFYDWTKLYL